jgi:hypothetical protein
MAMTTLPEVQETRPTPEPPARSRRALVGWAAVGLALVASVALTVQVLSSDPAPAADPIWYSVEHGSVAAVDHAAVAVRADRGSITAIDHAASAPASVADVAAEHGSIAALDHAAEAAAPNGVAETSAEHGSPTALDHEATDAER